jgi:hypothetical protein
MKSEEQPPVADDLARLPPEAASPITVRDVLKAVFMPPQEEEPSSLLTAVSVPHLWPAQPATPSSYAELDVAALTEPTQISYEQPPVEPVINPSTTRLVAMGTGTVLVLLLSYFGQSVLAGQSSATAGVILYGLAGLVWLALLLFEFALPDGGLLRRGVRITGGATARSLPMVEGRALNVRLLMAGGALALSVATYGLAARNTFSLPCVITWVLSVVSWLLVAAERTPAQLLSDWRAWWRSFPPKLEIKPVALIALLVILGAAVFFRFYRLDAIPNEMTSDHVEKLLDANDIANNGIYHIFFSRNGGREAVQFYLVALASKILGTGISFLTLKLVSALEALLFVPLMILFGREMVDRETGYFSAALVAVSWWHTMLGRLALRIVLTPLVFAMVLITLARGIRTGSRRAWIWAGVWMGVGMYAYQALRITPLVAVAAFVAAVAGPLASAAMAQLRKKADVPYRRLVAANVLGRQSLNLALAGLVAFAIFVPMLRVWHDYPADVWNRVVNRTTSSEVAIQGSPVLILADNYWKALGMFNRRGDVSWFSAVPGEPMLDLIAGGLFVLGLMAWLVRLRIRRDPADVFVLVAGLIMLLPSALAIAFPIENPSATRASGTIPIVFLLAAWPLALIRQRWSAVLGQGWGNALAGGLIALLIGSSAFNNYHTYFVEYAESYRRSALNPGEVADAVREIIGADAPLDGVWLQGWPYWHDYRAIGIEAGDITFDHAIFDVTALIDYLNNSPERFVVRPLIFIVNPQDAEALAVLRERFPEGEAQRRVSATEGRDFILYVVPPD